MRIVLTMLIAMVFLAGCPEDKKADGDKPAATSEAKGDDKPAASAEKKDEGEEEGW